MKATVLLLVYCFISACAFAQVPIVYYDFEDNSNRTVQDRNPDMAINSGATIMNRIGSGFTTGGLAGAGTLNGGFSAGLGYSSNAWPTTTTDPGVNATQYLQFTANTTGFTGISVYLDAIRNSTNAPTKVGVLWSADGSTFSVASTSPLTPTTSYSNLKFNLPTGTDNQSSLVIRIYAYSAGNTSSNLTVDNVMVNGSTLITSRTLLDHATLGVSLTSGYTSDPVFTGFTIDGAGVVATLGGNTTLASLALGSGTLEIGSNTLTLTGTVSRTTGLVNAASGTVVLGGSSALTIPAMFSGTINKLSIDNSVSITTAGNLSVTGDLILNYGTFILGSNTLTVQKNITKNMGLLNASSGTLVLNGTSVQTISASIFSGNLNNLTINTDLWVTMNSNATITGTLTLTKGSYNIGTTTQTINGNIVRTNGVIAASSGTMVFSGSSAQTIASGVFSGNINNLTINNAAGVTNSANTTITTALTLTNGTYDIGTTTQTINGNITRSSGNINAASGTMVFSGSAAQTIASGVFSGSINNLTINNAAGVTTAADASITTTLALTNGTYNIGSSTQTINGNITRSSGNINAASGTMVFSGSAAQTIAFGVFSGNVNNLTINNGSGVTTAANATINTALTLTNGTYNIGSSTQTINGNIVRTNGVINAASGTMVFSGSSAQTIASGVFSGNINNLTINNASGVTTASDATITTALTLTSGTYNIGSSTHTINGNISRTSGVINAASGTMIFNGSSAQTIASGVFSGNINNLTVNNSAGVTTAANTTITTALTLTNGTYNIGSSTHTINGNIVRTNGVINAASGTMVFSGSSAQTIASGVFSGNINNLTINNASGVTTASDATITTALTLTSGTYNIGSSTQTINGTISRTSGVINASSGTIIFSGSSAQTIASGVFSGAVNNLTISNSAGVTTSANTTITTALTLSAGMYSIGSTTQTLLGSFIGAGGAMSATSGTVVFNGSTAQTIPSYIFSGNISNLTINNAAGVTNGSTVTTTTLVLTNGTYTIGSGNTHTILGTISRTNGTIDASSGTMFFSGSTAMTIPSGTFSTPVNNLTISNTGGVTNASNTTISTLLTLTNGTYNIGSTTQTINGNISRTSGVINAASGTMIFSGSAAQTIASGVFSGSINNLTISNSAGVTTAANTTITTALTLINGTYNIGSSTQTINGSISRTSGVINASSGTMVFSGSAAQSIPSGTTAAIANLTVQNSNGLTIHNNLSVTAALSLQTGFLALNGNTLTLGGAISGSGTLRGSALSGVTITGAVGTLSFDQATDGTTNALSTLLVSTGSATLGSKLHLYTALDVAGGTLDLAARNLVLKSNASQTAYVAEIKGTLVGETNVTVERYSPIWSTRRWRLMTSPLMNTSINNAWQEGNKWDGTSALPASGFGTLITGQAQGNATTANSNGFDFWTAIAGSSSSIRRYVPGTTTGTWQNISSTTTAGAFNNHEAYLLFIRGDRAVSTGTVAGATTLRPNGQLKKGSVTINVPSTNSHVLIGNPYASPLDFKKLYDDNSSKIQPQFWKWQASLGSGTGGYVLIRPVSAGSSLYEAIPGDGDASSANRLIHSGEGFFVMPEASTGTGNTITIQEAHKSTTTPGVSVFRQMGTDPAKLYINVTTTANNEKILLDGALAVYDERELTGGITKTINSSENLAIQKSGRDLTVAAAGTLPRINDTIKIRMWNLAMKSYELQIRTANLASLGLTALLVDRYLQKETILDLNNTTSTYAYEVNNDAQSKDPLRFYITFKAGTTLPLSITTLKASERAGVVTIEWSVSDESGIRSYALEKSIDGINFTALASIMARSGLGEQAYMQTDIQPGAITYYRIKMTGTAGETKYSAVTKVQLQPSGEGVTIYPNPVTSGMFNLQFTRKPQGDYTVTLYNLSGQKVFSKAVRLTSRNATESFNLDKTLLPGVYRLEIKDQLGKGQVISLNVLK